jgi:ribose 1,5-bisphosphokinase PhnN
VVVVLVTAPEAVLEARLASRGRASDGHHADRITRAGTVGRGVDADVLIENVGSPDVGIAQLVAAFGAEG